MEDGLLMCAKYALPPNVLKYCGPDDSKRFSEVLKKKEGEELREMLLKFEGAVPYLNLIAQSNGIKDIFDYRVVEAYWLGNSLLKKVSARDLFLNIKDRFGIKTSKNDWKSLLVCSIEDAKPFHGFHVLDIYRRTGFLKSGKIGNLLDTINRCSIRHGVVAKQSSLGSALVEHTPFVFKDKKLCWGDKKTDQFFLLDESLKKGDSVAIHWEYVCDKITKIQKSNLCFWVQYHLNLANKTI